MAQGPKQASKTTSSNRLVTGFFIVPLMGCLLAFLPPHVGPGETLTAKLYFAKFGFLMKNNPLLGFLLLTATFLAIDASAKMIGGGSKIGETGDLAEYEGK